MLFCIACLLHMLAPWDDKFDVVYDVLLLCVLLSFFLVALFASLEFFLDLHDSRAYYLPPVTLFSKSMMLLCSFYKSGIRPPDVGRWSNMWLDLPPLLLSSFLFVPSPDNACMRESNLIIQWYILWNHQRCLWLLHDRALHLLMCCEHIFPFWVVFIAGGCFLCFACVFVCVFILCVCVWIGQTSGRTGTGRCTMHERRDWQTRQDAKGEVGREARTRNDSTDGRQDREMTRHDRTD